MPDGSGRRGEPAKRDDLRKGEGRSLAQGREEPAPVEDNLAGHIPGRLEAYHSHAHEKHDTIKSMKPKVERLASSIAGAISSWDAVECIALAEHSESDVLDPNFALVVDAYLRADPPRAEERQAAYALTLGQPGAFETSTSRSKDRFFIEGLPVRAEYKSVAVIDEVLARCKDPDSQAVWILKNSGTYMFYRLQRSRVLFQKTSWIDTVRKDLGELPEAFWALLREADLSKMEHYLSDLGAATLSDDGYFYDVSLAGYIRYAAAAVFVANRRFEPSHRHVTMRLRELKRLPGDFLGRWETLLRPDIDISRSQKYEVAELLAKSVLAIA